MIVPNPIRQDFQQFGIRHAPTVDPVNAYRIDVVRGPMSVIFGSDASGMGRNIQLSLSAQLR